MTSRVSEWFDDRTTCQRGSSGGTEPGNPQQIVGGCDQVGGKAGPLDSSIARTAEVAGRFAPAEDLLDSLAHPLAQRVTRPAGGALVECRATRSPVILRDIGSDGQFAVDG